MNKQEMLNDERIVRIKGKEYLTHEGLKSCLDDRWGKENYAVQVHLPTTPEENRVIRDMLGIEPGVPYVVARGEVYVRGIDKPFINFGSAHEGSLSGYVGLEAVVEMASTRAANRAMRLAAGASLASVDELPDGGYSPGQQQQAQQQQRLQSSRSGLFKPGPHPPQNDKRPQQRPPAAQQSQQSGGPKLATDKQRNLLRYLVKSDKLSDTQRVNLQTAIDNEELVIGQASALINKAKAVVDGDAGKDTGGEAMATDQQLAALSKIAYNSQNGLSDSQRADLARTLRENDQAKDMTEAAAQSLIDEFTKAASGS